MTRSTGDSGFTLSGSLFLSLTISLIAARSATAGIPVKSCNKTLAGLYAISLGDFFSLSHSLIANI